MTFSDICLGPVTGIQDIFFDGDQRSIFLSIWILIGIAAYWLLYLLVARKDYINKQGKDIEKLDKIRADLKKQCLDLVKERAEWKIRLTEV